MGVDIVQGTSYLIKVNSNKIYEDQINEIIHNFRDKISTPLNIRQSMYGEKMLTHCAFTFIQMLHQTLGPGFHRRFSL